MVFCPRRGGETSGEMVGVGFPGLRVEQHQPGVLDHLLDLSEVTPQLGFELGG